MADTSFSDTTTSTPGTLIVSVWLNVINKLVYWGRNPLYAITTGTANAQVLTLPTTSLYSTYGDGDTFTFKASLSNTSAMTLQIVGASALVAKSVVTQYLGALTTGTVLQGSVYTVVYVLATDNFILMGSMQPCIALE